MLFFPKKRSRASSFQGGGSLIRSLLLVLVFGACAWGFWVNSHRQIERLNARGTVWDETGGTSEESREAMRSIARMFQERYGLNVRIVIREAAPLDEAAPDDKTILIAAVPGSGEVDILVPPLVRRGLPPTFFDDLKKEILAPSLTKGTYEVGIIHALNKLWTALGEEKAP